MTTTRQLESSEPYAGYVLTGNSPAISRLRMQVARIAPHFRLALITGERGVGKAAIAREMHRLSPVGTGPLRIFSSVEFVEQAKLRGAGTLLIRDLDVLSPELQRAALERLKVISRESRVLVTCGPDLRLSSGTGKMRPELHLELGMLELRGPALRERLEDLEAISGAMLNGLGLEATFAAASLATLRMHGWQGNVGELWEFCRELSRSPRSPGTQILQPQDLPVFNPVEELEPESMRLDDVIRRHVLDVLERCAGNKLKAAEVLGISRSTLYRMLDMAPAEAGDRSGREGRGANVLSVVGARAKEAGAA